MTFDKKQFYHLLSSYLLNSQLLGTLWILIKNFMRSVLGPFLGEETETQQDGQLSQSPLSWTTGDQNSNPDVYDSRCICIHAYFPLPCCHLWIHCLAGGVFTEERPELCSLCGELYFIIDSNFHNSKHVNCWTDQSVSVGCGRTIHKLLVHSALLCLEMQPWGIHDLVDNQLWGEVGWLFWGNMNRIKNIFCGYTFWHLRILGC